MCFCKVPENEPKFPKWPFYRIFPKFQKHVFCTIILDYNAKFRGSRVKMAVLESKTFIRTFGNIFLSQIKIFAKKIQDLSSSKFLELDP